MNAETENIPPRDTAIPHQVAALETTADNLGSSSSSVDARTGATAHSTVHLGAHRYREQTALPHPHPADDGPELSPRQTIRKMSSSSSLDGSLGSGCLPKTQKSVEDVLVNKLGVAKQEYRQNRALVKLGVSYEDTLEAEKLFRWRLGTNVSDEAYGRLAHCRNATSASQRKSTTPQPHTRRDGSERRERTRSASSWVSGESPRDPDEDDHPRVVRRKSGTLTKIDQLTGYELGQRLRAKGVMILGTTEEDIFEETTRQLGELGLPASFGSCEGHAAAWQRGEFVDRADHTCVNPRPSVFGSYSERVSARCSFGAQAAKFILNSCIRSRTHPTEQFYQTCNAL